MVPGHVFPERLPSGTQLPAQPTLRPGRGQVARLYVVDHVPAVGAGVAALIAVVGARTIQHHLGLDDFIQGLEPIRGPEFLQKE